MSKTTEDFPYCTLIDTRGNFHTIGEKVYRDIEIKETQTDDEGNQEVVTTTKNVLIGEFWVFDAPYDDFDFLESAKILLEDMKYTREQTIPQAPFLVVYYDVKTREEVRREELNSFAFLNMIQSKIEQTGYYPTPDYPFATILNYAGKESQNGGVDWVGGLIYGGFWEVGEIWIWNTPARNPLFIRKAKHFLDEVSKVIKSQIEWLGYDDAYNYKYHIVFYRIGENTKRGEQYVYFDEALNIITRKINEMTRILTYIYNKSRIETDRDDKMAGGDLYHPLNAFWESNPKKGVYRSFEFERKRFMQRQVGQKQYTAKKFIEISNGIK